MSRVTAGLLYWFPRILSIAFAIFLSLFALDVFNEIHGFWQTVPAFSIHLIPAMIFVAALIVAWRWEWIGAGLFALAAVYYGATVLPRHINWALVISLPQLLIATLFLVNWIERSKVRLAR